MANFKGFDKNSVKMPGRSGFDCSHSNFFTADCGTLTPCLVDWLNPGDKIHLNCDNLQVQLPPMASDFYGYIQAKVECFFVPNRVLYGGWQYSVAPFLTGVVDGKPSYSVTPLPYLKSDWRSGGVSNPEYPLLEYMGLRANSFILPSVVPVQSGYVTGSFDLFPLLAYHKVYEDWYKDLRIQRPSFVRPDAASGAFDLETLPFIKLGEHQEHGYLAGSPFYDGVKLGSLRQRLFSKDIFTNATYEPQQGDAVEVEAEDGKFTIASLRTANAIQQYLERNNIAGNSYQDRIKAHFGVYPSDAVVDRSIYLGRFSVPVYTKGVYQTNGDSSGLSTNNPMNSVGSKYGSSQAVGRGSLVDSFEVTEHGVLLCLFSLVPSRAYSSGTRRQWFNTEFSDYPDPILASVGDEEIYISQIVDPLCQSDDYDFDTDGKAVFGYTQRYSSYKYMPDEVHGLLRDGDSLSSFALQSRFASAVLGSDFLEIPTDYLDGVTAVSGDVSKFGCWVDSHWDYKKVSTLPAYSIPTLENLPLDGHYEEFNSGGFRL